MQPIVPQAGRDVKWCFFRRIDRARGGYQRTNSLRYTSPLSLLSGGRGATRRATERRLVAASPCALDSPLRCSGVSAWPVEVRGYLCTLPSFRRPLRRPLRNYCSLRVRPSLVWRTYFYAPIRRSASMRRRSTKRLTTPVPAKTLSASRVALHFGGCTGVWKRFYNAKHFALFTGMAVRPAAEPQGALFHL
jgi:hypothetical protein